MVELKLTNERINELNNILSKSNLPTDQPLVLRLQTALLIGILDELQILNKKLSGNEREED